MPESQTARKPRTVRMFMWSITSPLADRLFTVSNVLLVIGAAIVLVGTIGAVLMSSVREQFANERISSNEAETARAKAEGVKAQLELAKYKAPRSLTDEQITRIRDRLRKFAGQRFGMITYWDEKEPDDFTKRIGDAALIGAGWKFVKAERFEAILGIVTGIEIALSDDSDVNAKLAAQELVSALGAEGFGATIRSDPTYKDMIKIRVGTKQ